jgi:hypothetical protein
MRNDGHANSVNGWYLFALNKHNLPLSIFRKGHLERLFLPLSLYELSLLFDLEQSCSLNGSEKMIYGCAVMHMIAWVIRQ